MNVNLGMVGKLTSAVAWLLVVAGVLAGGYVVFFWYRPLIQQNQRYRRAILELDTKIAGQERLNKQLRAALDAMQNDPKTLERLAREKLGYARTNETVIRFEAANPVNGLRR